MSIQAQTPDGVVHQFPDGTPDAVVDKVIKDYVAAKPQAPAERPNLWSQITGAAAGAVDKLKSDVVADYHATADETRRHVPSDSLVRQTGILGDVVGLATKPVSAAINGAITGPAAEAISKLPIQAYSRPSLSLDGGPHIVAPKPLSQDETKNALQGDLNTALSALPAARGGSVNGLVGATSKTADVIAVPKMADPLSGAGNLLRKAPIAPDIGALQAVKAAAYKAVDDAGVQYTPQAVQTMADGIAHDLGRANLSPLVHPKASAVLAKIQDLAANRQPPTLTELDQLRQFVRRDLLDPKNSDGEQFMGRQIISGMDKFLDSAGPGDVISGDPQHAAGLLNAARRANAVYRKAETISDALDSAKLRAGSTGSGGNIENATRQAIRQQLEKLPGLTQDEQDGMRQIVLGTPAQNIARLAGKLSPQGNGLMASMSLSEAAMGGFLGGTHGAAAGAVPAAVGMAAKYASDAMAARKVNALLRLVAAGGDKEAVAAALDEPQTGVWAVRIAAASGKGRQALSSAVGRLGAAAKANAALLPLYAESRQLLPPAVSQSAHAESATEPQSTK